YFGLMYLEKKFDLKPDDNGHQIAFGGNDYGLDGYLVHRPSRNLYLFQFKWSVNPLLFKESLERLAKDGLETVFGDGPKDPNRNEFLHRLHDDLIECRDLIERVYVEFVFKGHVDAADNSE